MNSIYDELLGPKRYQPWAKENPVWWVAYRTAVAGVWSKQDISEFNNCPARYIIFFDHARTDEACSFAIHVMERDDHFKACKVSKFARDDEKVLVFLGKDASRQHKMSGVCKELGFKLWGVKGPRDYTPLEIHLRNKYDEYLYNLGMAYRGMPDGRVRVKNFQM